MSSPYKIAVLGLWHLGEIYSAGLAELGHSVVGLSDDEKIIKNLLEAKPPLPEPDLENLIRKNLETSRLSYSTDFREIEKCRVLWITFDTPVDDNDDVDLTVITTALKKSLPHLSNGILIVVTSQVPVGTAKTIRELISASRPDLKFGYACVPENLRLGNAVKCFFDPGRIIIGASEAETSDAVVEIFKNIPAEILKMSPASAEMAKHATNAFLATSVSFINDISDICEKVGADVQDVTRALRSEPRIGPKAFLDSGLGFSGGTLGRDLKVLMSVAKKENIEPFILDDVYNKNLARKDFVIRRLVEILGSIQGKTIALFGLTYKPGTPTLRRSRALEIAALLLQSGANLKLHDPAADEQELANLGSFDFFRDPYAAVLEADSLILVTPWPEFKNLDFQAISNKAKPNAVFFDVPNFLCDKEREIGAIGLRYFGTGRG